MQIAKVVRDFLECRMYTKEHNGIGVILIRIHSKIYGQSGRWYYMKDLYESVENITKLWTRMKGKGFKNLLPEE